MFFWNISQNIISCYRFYINTYYITNQFETINQYLDYTIEKMKLYHNITKKFSTYQEFNKKLLIYIDKLQQFHNSIRNLPINNNKFGKIKNIGSLMKNFYILYDDQNINNIIHYSLDLRYIDSILGINKNIQNKILKCSYKKK